MRQLIDEIRVFAEARNWAGYHTPKNLAMALAGEVGELVAEFQWLTLEESERRHWTDQQLQRIRSEVADVAIYFALFVDRAAIDVDAAVREKLAINSVRFPIVPHGLE